MVRYQVGTEESNEHKRQRWITRFSVELNDNIHERDSHEYVSHRNSNADDTRAITGIRPIEVERISEFESSNE
jgi:hypothetical protein